MIISSYLIGDLVAFVLTVVVIVVIYCKWCFQYWSKRNVPNLEPTIPFGNFSAALTGKEHLGVSLKKIYDEFKSLGYKHGGVYIFTKPDYFPIDLDLVRNILTKDFQYFIDRNVFVNKKRPLQAHLFNLKGNEWKNLRAKLSPTFTSGKMKMMFGVMAECQHDLLKRLEKECLKNEPIDIKEILACFTTNIIGSCAFGLDFEALEDEKSSFRAIGRKIFAPSKKLSFLRMFAVAFPQVVRLLQLVQGRKELVDFIINMVEDTIKYRETNNITRNDFMQLLINLKNKPPTNPGDHDGKPLTMDEIASQAILFFAAGFETSSTLMTFALYELAKSQKIQDKLRGEINRVLGEHNNEISYDSVQDNKYLSQVLDETLRMHPPAPQLVRECVKDYKVPNEDVIIEKGTNLTIPILGIHYDEEYYPDPYKFDPERFSDKNKVSRHPYAFLPFGEGPRNCIGLRFGLMQAKVGLVALVRNFKFTLNEKTQEPMIYNPHSIVLTVKGDVWLNAEKV